MSAPTPLLPGDDFGIGELMLMRAVRNLRDDWQGEGDPPPFPAFDEFYTVLEENGRSALKSLDYVFDDFAELAYDHFPQFRPAED